MRALQATPLGGNGIPQILGRGIELTARGEFARALEIFAAVYNNVSPERFPQGLSSYGLCLSRIEHKNKVGAELCEKAIALQPHDASHWANLVRLYAGAKNRRRAVDVLERAMKKLPNDERLLRVRTEIGYRQRPYFRFLRRTNPINRLYSRYARPIRIVIGTAISAAAIAAGVILYFS